MDDITKLAAECAGLIRNEILVNLRFLDTAVLALKSEARPRTGCFATDMDGWYYDPAYLLTLYKDEPKEAARACLHSLMHCIFAHGVMAEGMDTELWDMSCDIAAEAVIEELDIRAFETSRDMSPALKYLKKEAGGLTADRLYRYLKRGDVSEKSFMAWKELFYRDSHALWRKTGLKEISSEEWERISRRIRTEIKAFSELKGFGDTLKDNLDAGLKEKYDYRAILERFMINSENRGLSDDEFDLALYTRGMELYGNLPLIEPLEYREDKLIREFVIALDTSASCSGEKVKNFVRRSFEILGSREHFAESMKVHILQCDSGVRSDDVINSADELDAFLEGFTLKGMGGTDFNPVFEYVSGLIAEGKFENLKGLIYFTDGYGIYPRQRPPYEVVFAFLRDDDNAPPVPAWSIKAVLETEEL